MVVRALGVIRLVCMGVPSGNFNDMVLADHFSLKSVTVSRPTDSKTRFRAGSPVSSSDTGKAVYCFEMQ